MNIAGRFIDWFYWVVDGIYQDYRIFLKTIQAPKTKQERRYVRAQEAFRKGFERFSGVLFSRWHILAHPSRPWYTKDMDQDFQACFFMHTMVVECRDADSTMRTKSIVSIDPNAEVIPVRTNSRPLNDYDAADYIREPADSISHRNYHALLQGAIADAMRKRYGRDDAPLEGSEAGEE